MTVDDRLAEVDYGDWTGRTFKELHREPLWKTVAAHPAEVTFPNGEPLRAMATRAVVAVREWNERLGPDATYVVVSHADPIRAILADALGLHFEGYQRLVVGPGSLSVVRYGRPARPGSTMRGQRPGRRSGAATCFRRRNDGGRRVEP